MKKMFELLWNTGDEYWDNEPEVEDIFSIDELLENDRLNLSDEDIDELMECGFISDDYNEIWQVRKV